MFKNILSTIFTRLFTAAVTLLIVVINARQLGAGNLGTISLIILAVTIIQLFNNFVAGGALIYMTPRAGIFRLIIPAVVWTVSCTLIISFFLWSLGSFSEKLDIIPKGYFYEVISLALIISLSSMTLNFLLGLEKVIAFNLISIVHITLTLACLCSFIFIFHNHSVMAYYWALFISHSLVFLIGLFNILPSVKIVPLAGMKQLIKEIFRFGFYIQVANFFQQLNYRLSYYIIDFFSGRLALGVFSVGVQVSEGVWLIPRSIGMVQYARISNQMDPLYANRLTLTLAKITWVVTLLAMVVILLIPGIFFQLVFGAEFSQIRPVIASLGVGIITLSVSMVFSQFFSGINRPYHNTVSSAIGLVFTLGAGLFLIPRWGIIGAGITASISYTVATAYQFIVFMNVSHLKARDFLIRESEVQLLISELKSLIRP